MALVIPETPHHCFLTMNIVSSGSYNGYNFGDDVHFGIKMGFPDVPNLMVLKEFVYGFGSGGLVGTDE